MDHVLMIVPQHIIFSIRMFVLGVRQMRLSAQEINQSHK